jgi:hypothetical protein
VKLSPSIRVVLQTGPLFALTLIAILLLSAIIYYRATNVQRFLEPALAISKPRLKFSQNIKKILSDEFGAADIKGIRFKAGSILVDQSLLFDASHPARGKEPLVLRRLGHVFLSALKDPEIRRNISLILVCVRYPVGLDAALEKELRFHVQERAAVILNSLFASEPELERDYVLYFLATALPVDRAQKEPSVLEFRLVPAERLHIEILESLEKYAY